jgi:hypothetical protein
MAIFEQQIIFDSNDKMRFWTQTEKVLTQLRERTIITQADFLVIGGGGGGASFGGGGGAGGFVYQTGITIEAGTYSVVVGTGGAPAFNSDQSDNFGINGTNSSITGSSLSIIAYGGGGGGGRGGLPIPEGKDGASGGGGAPQDTGTQKPGGDAIYGSQGNKGGSGGVPQSWAGGGGGGAGFSGDTGNANITGGDGGDGLPCSITGTEIYYAGGGGGCMYSSGTPGNGGLGGGGNGGNIAIGVDGVDGKGGGGGAGGFGYRGGYGGDGVVIVRYKASDFGTCTGGTITTDGSYKVHTFTSNGTLTMVAL